MAARNITTILFDCDNTLVLSEDLAFEGCADLINDICKKRDIKLEKPFTGETLIVEFVGQNFRGMLKTLQDRYKFDITADEEEEYVKAEEDIVIAKLKAKAQPCVGVDPILAKLAADAKYKLAVVSSSALRRVKASIEKVDQAKYFGDDVFSAATSLPTPTSKPDPAIYLHALKTIGVTADESIAVEDSKSGSLSGSRAGLFVVGYVGPYPDERKDVMRQVLTDAGCKVVMENWSEFPKILEEIQAGKY